MQKLEQLKAALNAVKNEEEYRGHLEKLALGIKKEAERMVSTQNPVDALYNAHCQLSSIISRRGMA